MFYQHCRELSFAQTPDYAYLHRLLRDLIYVESYTHMLAFEWLVKKQEFRPKISVSSSTTSLQQRSVVKDRLSKEYRERGFAIKPIPVEFCQEDTAQPQTEQQAPASDN